MQYPDCYKGTQSYAFISYAHADSEQVLPLLSGLSSRGIRLWYDSGIEIGSEWPEHIAQAVYGSSCVLCFLSRNAVNSDNCRREINFAISQKKDILAIYLEEGFPRPLGVAMQLDSLHAVFLPRYDDINRFLDILADAKLLRECQDKSTIPIREPNLPKKPRAPENPQAPLEPFRRQPVLYAFGSKDCMVSTIISISLIMAIAIFYLIGSIAANHPGPFLIVSLPLSIFMLYLITTRKSEVDNAGALRRKVASEHQIVCEGPAYFIPPATTSRNKKPQKGWLFLTRNAIIFYPRSFEMRHAVLFLPLTEITQAGINSWKNGNFVVETPSCSYFFSVYSPKRWAQSIYDITM